MPSQGLTRSVLRLASVAVALQACTTPSKPPARPTQEHLVEIDVHGVRSDAGVLRIAVYADPTTFLREGGVLHGVSVPPSTTKVTLAVPNDTPVVISVFHDLDADAQLRRGPLGMPSEPWGFSGHPPRIGPPVWASCAITPVPNSSVVITLRGAP